MAKRSYIVYTEPDAKRSGCEVKFYTREFDYENKSGKSNFFRKDVKIIIPSFEMPDAEVCGKMKRLKEEFPAIEFKEKYYSSKKKVIWAYLKNKTDKALLPDEFLKEKTSPSQQMRFYYPVYTIVNAEDGQLILPEKLQKSAIDIETILNDKKCALDIETIDYENPKNERISNVVLNFGPGNRKEILTIFKTPFNEFRGYTITHCKDTDDITKKTDEIIHAEDPLILYGYNIEFDQKRLRDLGNSEYRPGIDDTRPVYKSVQGIKNMITKGIFTIDLYGYLFMYRNLYENNKLETHARMAGIDFKKGLSYDVLAYKTKKAEQGSVKDMEEVLKYVVEDGETTYNLGEKNARKIIQTSLFSKRDPSTICTTSGKNVMKEFWQRKFFLEMNTLKNRYEHGYYKENSSLENDKDKLLNLEKQDGLFENVSLVYPLLFVKSFWPMIEGTTDNLRFDTPDECYNSYQLLNEFITIPMKEFMKFEEKSKKMKEKGIKCNYDYIMKGNYGIDSTTIRDNLGKNSKKFNELLEKSGLINYSKKFLYVNNPKEITKEQLGFVYGKGNCLMSGEKIVSLIGDKLIYQGFGISKGKKTEFGVGLMREFIKKRLSLEDESKIIEFMYERIKELKEQKVPKEKLIFKESKKLEDIKTFFNCNGPWDNWTAEKEDKKDDDEKEVKKARISYGLIGDRNVYIDHFLDSNEKYNYQKYINNFLKSFSDVLYIGFKRKDRLERVFQD